MPKKSKIDWPRAAEKLAKILAFPKNLAEKIASAGTINFCCSAGADSVCALLLTWANFPRERQKMRVLHFNHETRGNANLLDEKFVKDLSGTLNLPFVAGTISEFSEHSENSEISEISENSKKTEAAFRAARLNFFASVCVPAKSAFPQIFIQGHHADDVVETMLMRLTRGAGTAGLAAPREISKIVHNQKTLEFLRPLLHFSKREILAAMRAAGTRWREDSSNRGNDYFRNRIRHFVVPALEKSVPANYDLRAQFLRSREKFESDAKKLESFCGKTCGSGDIPVAASRPRGNAPSGSGDILVAASKNLQKVDLTSPATRMSPLPQEPKPRDGDKNVAAPTCSFPQIFISRVRLTKKLREQILAGTLSSPSHTCEFLAVPANANFVLRPWRAGDRMHPLGAPGSQTIGNLFTNRKIPLPLRANAPVLVVNDVILWCAHLGIANSAKISPKTRVCLKIVLDCGGGKIQNDETFNF